MGEKIAEATINLDVIEGGSGSALMYQETEPSTEGRNAGDTWVKTETENDDLFEVERSILIVDEDTGEKTWGKLPNQQTEENTQNIKAVDDALATKVNAREMSSHVSWEEDSLKLSGGSISFTDGGAEKKAEIGADGMTIPSADITILNIGDFILEYMESEQAVVLKER